MEETSDPYVFIEEKSKGYVRYINTEGKRWEVHGECIQLGNCIIGAVIETEHGPVQIKDHEHIEKLKKELGVERLGSLMDVPVTPGFSGCCDLKIVEL